MDEIEQIRSLLDNPFPDQEMSDRELEVAKLAAFGFTNVEIGKALNIKPSLVDYYLQKVKTKTKTDKFGLTKRLIQMIRNIVDRNPIKGDGHDQRK